MKCKDDFVLNKDLIGVKCQVFIYLFKTKTKLFTNFKLDRKMITNKPDYELPNNEICTSKYN